MTDTLVLSLDWATFSLKIQKSLSDCDILMSKCQDATDEDSYKDVLQQFESWKTYTDELLSDSFNEKRNQYVLGFRAARNVAYGKPSEDISKKKGELLEHLRSKQRQVLFAYRIISVSDAIINPTQIDLEGRKSYSVDEKIELILHKLYDIYDRFGYPIKDILIGNGIPLKRPYEDREFAALMEESGLIELTGLGGASARITLQGARAVENSRKQKSTNYNTIHLTVGELNERFDLLHAELRKLGLGHQIIFDEIDALRLTYDSDRKKEWIQTLKGKLIDIVVSNAASKEGIKHIFKFLTGQDLNLPGLDL